ncbi:MAG: phosphoglucosamine mutase [Candidatus Eremiobacteraeota bacterium]|nr:phosphoglucosamine mutase [Candidatus Eremiobacteraeota bacterium]
MISASHNPIEDNGIKFFGPDGFKLSDEDEEGIEALLDDPAATSSLRPTGLDVGMSQAMHGLVDRYFVALIEDGARLAGMTVVVDCAYGAAYEIAPHVFRRLGAEVVELHCEDDGSQINVECGATDLRALRARVGELRAAENERVIGVAFDGDADRVLFVDEEGQEISGDHVMLILGREMQRAGALPHSTVVGTVMSNAGLEKALAAEGIRLERTPVGDRYVLEEMRAHGYRFGGEQSGHVIDLTRNTTGDGPATAVALLSTVARSGKRLHDLAAAMQSYPQVLVNVTVRSDGGIAAREALLSAPAVRAATDRAAEELAGDGRILVRPSGTEPLLRVMLEGPSREQIDRLAASVAAAIQAAEHARSGGRSGREGG